MGRQTVILELAVDPAVARDLAAGGVFVPGCAVGLDQDCDLIVRGAGDELTVAARVVFVDGRGAGLQLSCDAEVLKQLVQMATPPEPEPEAPPEEDEEARKIPLNAQQRLRGLTLIQQIKVAQHGLVSERIILERMYGKNVWEPLLHNPRLTGPEVARIARMGTLPRVLVEVIVTNGAWLQIPEVRRALLSNPRLGVDQIVRVLRMLPKHELKLAATQTAYPFAVRDQAKRMLRDGT